MSRLYRLVRYMWCSAERSKLRTSKEKLYQPSKRSININRYNGAYLRCTSCGISGIAVVWADRFPGELPCEEHLAAGEREGVGTIVCDFWCGVVADRRGVGDGSGIRGILCTCILR